MPDNAIEILKKYNAIYLGAVGYPGVPEHISLWDLLLKIRHEFDQYVNVRPVKLLNGAPCPLKDIKREDIDMAVIRKNSEGEYAGAGDWLFKGQENEVVLQTDVFSRKGTERIICNYEKQNCKFYSYNWNNCFCCWILFYVFQGGIALP